MGLRSASAATAVAALLSTGSAAAATGSSASWAAPQIRSVAAAGLMGAKGGAAFRPNDRLTAQALENLVFGLQQAVFPPAPLEPAPVAPVPVVTVPTDPAPVDPAPADPVPVDPAPVDPIPVATEPTATTPAPEPAPAPAPAVPRKVANPGRAVTVSQLDARLVQALGLAKAAQEFAAGARAAGLKVPSRFGTEVVARLLGLRTNHPAEHDGLELLPGDPATRAEAAYSAAQVLGFTGGWQVAGIQSLADGFALPQLSAWQTRILDTAVARIGMPYVWGGTSDGPETEFGVSSRGGYDCSGFVWRVYKLQSYPGAASLSGTLRGRTTFQMSAEVPKAQRLGLPDLQPADVIFFGDRGPRSQPAQVGHMGIYLGNGWFVHSSGYGVALATLDGWYQREFAWARRPLREAGLSG